MNKKYLYISLLILFFNFSCSDDSTSSDNGRMETGTVTDIDGNVYQTVKIGDQWWMAENLKVTRYSNGDVIPNVTNDDEWKNLNTGAYCVYDNDDSKIATYGLLYNWYAVNDSSNIAPEGWHVPTDAEWKELEMYLGMNQIQTDSTGYRGTDQGMKLKSTSNWNNNGNGTNESGFSALPGGYHNHYYGPFDDIGIYGYWWSLTEFNSDNAWYRVLGWRDSAVGRVENNKRNGFSVRCVMD